MVTASPSCSLPPPLLLDSKHQRTQCQLAFARARHGMASQPEGVSTALGHPTQRWEDGEMGFDSVAPDRGAQHPPPGVFRGNGSAWSPPSHMPLTKWLRAIPPNHHACRLRHRLQSLAQASQPSHLFWQGSLAAPRHTEACGAGHICGSGTLCLLQQKGGEKAQLETT